MRTFQLGGTSFNEGDTLTITAPELGTLDVAAKLQPFSHGNVTALDLGWIKTPQPCYVVNPGSEVNAKLSLYSNGQGYNTLLLAYHCSCAYNVHNRYLKWFGVKIDGQTVSVDTLGAETPDHRHLIVDAFAHLRTSSDQWQPVKPVVKPLHPVPIEQTTTVKPLPVPEPVNVGRHGQFTLF